LSELNQQTAQISIMVDIACNKTTLIL